MRKKNEQAQAQARASTRTAPSGGPELRPLGLGFPARQPHISPSLSRRRSCLCTHATGSHSPAEPPMGTAVKNTWLLGKTHLGGAVTRHLPKSMPGNQRPCTRVQEPIQRPASGLQTPTPHITQARPCPARDSDSEVQGPRCRNQREGPNHQPAKQRGPADVRGLPGSQWCLGDPENGAMEPALRMRKQLQTARRETCIRYREPFQVNNKFIKTQLKMRRGQGY